VNLKICLEANAARTSQLRSRLHATLDTLDALQRAHAQELADEARRRQRLAGQLDHYIDQVKRLSVERDDLQDAVLQLVEKGGSGFNYCCRWVGRSESVLCSCRPLYVPL
jgi:hypothetical protein